MMILDYKALFEPYTRDGNVLENALRYLQKTAKDLGMAKEAVALAVQEIFQEVAAGKEFPKDKCPCGCESEKAGTGIIHAMRDRMFEIDGRAREATRKLLNDRNNLAILRHIEAQNAEYIERSLRPNRLLDWERSPVVKAVKKVKNGLVRNRKRGSVSDSNANG